MASSKPPHLIDAMEPLTIDIDRGWRHEKERQAIIRLHVGMTSLYNRVREFERRMVNAERDNPWELVHASGDADEALAIGIDPRLLAVSFDWYAINACRLFSILAFVSNEHAGNVKTAKAYRARVCGPVHEYRNKVAAHYALTDPRDDDNEADRESSTLDSFAFEKDRFYVGALQVGLRLDDREVAARRPYRWSMSAFHEDVVQRRLTWLAS